MLYSGCGNSAAFSGLCNGPNFGAYQMPSKRNIKPVSAKPVSVAKPANKPVSAKPRNVTVPGTTTAQAATGSALASGTALPVTATVNAAPVPANKPRASAIVRNFCRKANATGGRAKTSADTLSARDGAYLRLLGITAKRTGSATLRVADIADDYVLHGAAIFADHASKPVLDYSVLCGRLPSLGMLSAPINTDNHDTASISVIGIGLTNAQYLRGA